MEKGPLGQVLGVKPKTTEELGEGIQTLIFTPSKWEFQEIDSGSKFGRDGIAKSGLVAKIRQVFLSAL